MSRVPAAPSVEALLQGLQGESAPRLRPVRTPARVEPVPAPEVAAAELARTPEVLAVERTPVELPPVERTPVELPPVEPIRSRAVATVTPAVAQTLERGSARVAADLLTSAAAEARELLDHASVEARQMLDHAASEAEAIIARARGQADAYLHARVTHIASLADGLSELLTERQELR
jgi:hypothetical protein